MSVLIKGIDMPQSCFSCPCFDDEVTFFCCVLDIKCDTYRDKRHPDCPLVEIPTPHGDLVDRDDIDNAIRLIKPITKGAACEAIYNALTIIEAEEA